MGERVIPKINIEKQENKSKTNRNHNKAIFIICVILYMLIMNSLSVVLAIELNKFNYINNSNILFISSYIIGIPIITLVTMVSTSLFGSLSVKELGITELVRLIHMLIFCLIYAVFQREPDILLILMGAYWILAVIIGTIGKAVRIITDKTTICTKATVWCCIINGTALGISSVYLVLFNVPIDYIVIIVSVVSAIHLSSVFVAIHKKVRYIIVLILTLSSTIFSYCMINNKLSDKVYLEDFYNKGYNNIFKLSDYESIKGNLYTIYKINKENAEYVTSDNISFANLGEISDDYHCSLYETDNTFISFNWDNRTLVKQINKNDIKDKADRVLSKNFKVKHSKLGKGGIDAELEDGNIISLYIKPTYKGFQLLYTAKDMTKFGITEQVAIEIE